VKGTFKQHARTIERLRTLRTRADEHVGSRADIVGSMIGMKVRDEEVTPKLGITYFVKEKIADRKLSSKKRIPKRITIDGQHISTDVLVWPRMVEQGLETAAIVFDGKVQGSLSCFGRSAFGAFGVSCAHCLVGADGNPTTSTDVSMYSVEDGRFLQAGQSSFAAYAPGLGIAGNFGYLDCGLFAIEDAVLQGRAASATPLSIVEDAHLLINQRLIGQSALRAPDSPDPNRSAVLLGIDQNAMGERCDLVLRVDPPGTFQGDSGMMWFTSDMRAVALHARGEVMPPMTGSRLVSAMSAARAAQALGVTFCRG
jgi:hypothetical protein